MSTPYQKPSKDSHWPVACHAVEAVRCYELVYFQKYALLTSCAMWLAWKIIPIKFRDHCHLKVDGRSKGASPPKRGA